jgi:hypothetical protein
MPMFEHHAQGIDSLRGGIIVGRNGPLRRLCALCGVVSEERRQPGCEPATNHVTSLYHRALLRAQTDGQVPRFSGRRTNYCLT